MEIADVVRRNRGRLAWRAVGMNGAGLSHFATAIASALCITCLRA